MNRFLQFARIALALAGAFAFTAVGVVTLQWGPRIGRHVDGVLTRFEVVEGKLYGAAQNLDVASKVWSDSAQSQTRAVAQIAGTANDSLLAARGALESAQGTMDTINAQAAHVGPLLDSARNSTDALTANLGQLQTDESTLSKALDDLDAKINDPTLSATAQNVEKLTRESAGVAEDTRKVADHIEGMIDDPHKRPWYIRILPKTMQEAAQALLNRWALK